MGWRKSPCCRALPRRLDIACMRRLLSTSTPRCTGDSQLPVDASGTTGVLLSALSPALQDGPGFRLRPDGGPALSPARARCCITVGGTHSNSSPWSQRNPAWGTQHTARCAFNNRRAPRMDRIHAGSTRRRPFPDPFDRITGQAKQAASRDSGEQRKNGHLP